MSQMRPQQLPHQLPALIAKLLCVRSVAEHDSDSVQGTVRQRTVANNGVNDLQSITDFIKFVPAKNYLRK